MYQILRLNFRDQWIADDASFSEATEDEYILNHLAEALSERDRTFLETDKQRLLSVTAALFQTPNNPQLWKTYYPTGFSQLDQLLEGGLTAGVHYIGAISSLGKSTFALQMADQMAKYKIPVIYVSLEMSKIDLTAKLVSMYTFINTRASRYSDRSNLAKTSRILTSEATKNFSEEEWQTVLRAADLVYEHGQHITVLENRQGIVTIDDIVNYVNMYMDSYKTTPVLIIDYLQILAAPSHKQGCSDKQLVDYNVTQFRALAAKYEMPVIVISAFNRDNYNTRAGFQSFKDSGNIEYSGDTLIGLQLHGVGEKDFDVDQAKRAFPRKIDLVLLKQRVGQTSTTIPYNYYTKYNFFDEMVLEELPASTDISFGSSSQTIIKNTRHPINVW